MSQDTPLHPTGCHCHSCYADAMFNDGPNPMQQQPVRFPVDKTDEWEERQDAKPEPTMTQIPPIPEDLQEKLVERTAVILAHHACIGAEHDPANGRLHGFCVVCGVEWPCDYAKTDHLERIAKLTAEVEEIKNANALVFNGVTQELRKHIEHLKAEITRLKAPVTDDEWQTHVGGLTILDDDGEERHFEEVAERKEIDALIRSRAAIKEGQNGS